MTKLTQAEFQKLQNLEADRLEENAYMIRQGYIPAPAELISFIPDEYEIIDAD